jgi:hypothetical protein
VQLAVLGPVDRFATVTPSMVSLRGAVGESLKQTVRIVPEEKYPFKVLSAQPRDGKNIKVLLSAANDGQGGYSLLVENTKAEAGSHNDAVILKTDNKLKPEIEIRVYIYLRPPQPAEKKAGS